MSKDKDVSKHVGGRPSPRRPSAPGMVKAVNGLLVSIGTLYLATNSVVVAGIGAALAIILVVLYLTLYR